MDGRVWPWMAVDGCGICYVNMWNGYEWMNSDFVEMVSLGTRLTLSSYIIITVRLQPPAWIAHVSESMDRCGS